MTKKRFELAVINKLSKYKPLDFKESNLLLQKIEQMEKYEIERKSLNKNVKIIAQRVKTLKKDIYILTHNYKSKQQKFKDNRK